MKATDYSGPVFSYIRFSSAKQAEGDSERRQSDAAKKWCKDRNLTLDTSLRPDRAKSGFTQANLKKDGNLGLFLQKIKDGRVPIGSTLLVENLDRISRAAITSSFPLFLNIINSGVRVVTLMDGQEFTRENVDDESHKLYITIGTLARGHDESKTKSIRLKAAFDKLRKNLGDRKWPTNFPPWLALDADKKTFHPIESKVATIQRIFDDYEKGVGVFTIARTLQAEGVGRPSDGKCLWQTSTIQHYLKSRAVIGEFQPHVRTEGGGRTSVGAPIENYFPAIIDSGQFARVALKLATSKKTRGRRSRDLVNIFRGLLRCPYCGSSILLKRQVTSKGHRQDTFVCDRAQRFQTCLAFGWERNDFEACFLEYAAGVQKEYASLKILRPDARALPTVIAHLAELEARESKLLSLYLDGKFTKEKLDEFGEKMRVEKARFSQEKTRLENSVSGRTERQLKLDLRTFLKVDLADEKNREILAGVVSRLFWKIDLYFVGLPSRYKWLVARRKKLISGGLKGNQAYFKLAKECAFLSERFFVGHSNQIGAKPYPDFLGDEEFASLYDDEESGTGSAHEEFRQILAAADAQEKPR